MIYKQFEEEDKEKIQPIYNKDKLKYHNASADIKERFKLALFKEYDIENNPKREKVWALAWEEGHSSGFSEIEYYFMKYVELIK